MTGMAESCSPKGKYLNYQDIYDRNKRGVQEVGEGA